jgi:hypothetical protein
VLYTINISFQCFGLDFDLVIMQFIVFKMVPRHGNVTGEIIYFQGWVDYKIFVVRYNYSYFKNM